MCISLRTFYPGVSVKGRVNRSSKLRVQLSGGFRPWSDFDARLSARHLPKFAARWPAAQGLEPAVSSVARLLCFFLFGHTFRFLCLLLRHLLYGLYDVCLVGRRFQGPRLFTMTDLNRLLSWSRCILRLLWAISQSVLFGLL